MYNLYVLKSLKDLGYYIGIAENLELRLKQHNAGKTKSIKHRTPFILVHHEEYTTKIEVRKREILLKKNYKVRKELLQKLGFNIK